MKENEISAAISKYMSSLGKKGGAKNKAKGSAYFKMIRAKNKKSPVKNCYLCGQPMSDHNNGECPVNTNTINEDTGHSYKRSY